MPPAVLEAGIGLAGSLGGALIGSHSQSNALKAQQQANNQALQYQRERDAAADKRYERDYQDRQRALAAKDATRRAIAKHYGIDLGPAPGTATWMNASVPLETNKPVNPLNPNGPPVGGPPAAGPAPAGPAPQALSPEALKMGFSGPASATQDGGFLPGMSPGSPAAPAEAPPPAGDVSNWSDWSRYARL